MHRPPRRILLVSATIGEGHNATARAVEQAARDLWPEATVRWWDTLECMGRWVPRTFQWIYTTNVESTPWLYEFFYAALWRMRWFSRACRRFAGSWSGRRFRGPLADYRPDLIISTYPLGTAGLDWLRRRGELDAPVAAVVSDFAPHPLWVAPRIDMHYVMSDVSVREAHRAVPGAAVRACAPPVVSAFRPMNKAAARRSFGLPEDGFVVLVSCGSLAFGSIDRAVEVALLIPEVRRVVAVCARNEVLRDRLTERHRRTDRLVATGWVEDMPTLTAAADVVVTNAGGATALETIACGRTAVMFEPIAAHGRANAELMAEAGLAQLCTRSEDLATTLRRLATDEHELAEAEDRALRHSHSGEFTSQVAALARLSGQQVRGPLPPRDAFFTYVDRDVPQQAGAILELDVDPATPTEDFRRHLTELIARRAPDLPLLCHDFLPRRGSRPLWRVTRDIDPRQHLRCRRAHPDQREEVMAEFFTEPLRTDRPLWEMLLLRDTGGQRTHLLAKVHHALGDGLAITNSLLALLQDDTVDRTRFLRHPDAAPRWRRTGQFVRGLVSLARAGRAPQSGLEGASSPHRTITWAKLPLAEIRQYAHRQRLTSTTVLIGTVAEALHRYLDRHGGTVADQRFRVMVPRMAAGGKSLANAPPGNRTVAVAVDLPVGPMAPRQRLSEVAARLERSKAANQAVAAGGVLAALGRLPAPLHAWAARRVYQRRFFNGIVSILPGAHRPPRVAGAELTKVFPVIPLADGVGVGVAVITWNGMVGFGVTADSALVPDAGEIADDLRAAFAGLAGERGEHP